MQTVLISAGASAPEETVRDCIDLLVSQYGAILEEIVTRLEHVSFSLPKELRILQAASD